MAAMEEMRPQYRRMAEGRSLGEVEETRTGSGDVRREGMIGF